MVIGWSGLAQMRCCLHVSFSDSLSRLLSVRLNSYFQCCGAVPLSLDLLPCKQPLLIIPRNHLVQSQALQLNSYNNGRSYIKPNLDRSGLRAIHQTRHQIPKLKSADQLSPACYVKICEINHISKFIHLRTSYIISRIIPGTGPTTKID
jgi:hypothetical protein